MELGCEFPARVFARLYDLCLRLSRDGQLSEFRDRASSIGLDDDWFRWAVEIYELMVQAGWNWPLTRSHSLLAGWLLAGERAQAPRRMAPAEFEAELASLLEDTAGEDHPVLICWVLGRRVRGPQSWGPNAIAVPAAAPLDVAVADAFSGLIEHAHFLGSELGSGELGHTAVIWRIGAIIDGMTLQEHEQDGRAPALQDRLLDLVAQCAPRLTIAERAEFRATAMKVMDPRNTLTHVRAGHDGRSFGEYARQFAQPSELFPAVRLTTRLVFDRVGDEQGSSPNPGVAQAVESDLQRAVQA